MRARFKRPTIREERGQISSVAFIKLAFLISRSLNWNIHAWLFGEEGCICHFVFKRMSFTKFKDYPFTLENSKQNGPFSCGSLFQERFSWNLHRLPNLHAWQIEDWSSRCVNGYLTVHRDVERGSIWRVASVHTPTCQMSAPRRYCTDLGRTQV